MIEKINSRQKVHIKDLSERMVEINRLSFEIINYLNGLPKANVKLNPVSKRVLDIINLTQGNRL